MPVTLENHIKKVLTPDGRDIVPPEIAEFVQKLLEIKREHNLSTQQLIEYSKEELLEFTDEKIINFDKLLSNREANLISIDGVTDEAINKIKAYTANFNTLITNKSLMGIKK